MYRGTGSNRKPVDWAEATVTVIDPLPNPTTITAPSKTNILWMPNRANTSRSLAKGEQATAIGEVGDWWCISWNDGTYGFVEKTKTPAFQFEAGLPASLIDSFSTQGFAADSTVDTTYCYAFRISQDETKHVLYRYNMTTSGGLAAPMTPINNPGTGDPIGDLLHANDVALVIIGSNKFMYVLAGDEIVKLGYDGNGNYWETNRYSTDKRYAGITFIKHVNVAGVDKVRFLLKGGTENNYYYIADIGPNDTSVTAGSHKFITNRSPYVDATHGTQGIHYDRSNKKLYLTISGKEKAAGMGHESAILVYNYDVENISGTITHDGNPWHFSVEEGKMFEVEGCGINNGVIWFSTNEDRLMAGFPYPGSIYTATRRIQ